MSHARTELVNAAGRLNRAVGTGATATASERALTVRRVEELVDHLESVERDLSRSIGVATVGRLPLLSRQRAGALELVRDGQTAARSGLAVMRTLEGSAGRQIERGTVPLAAVRELEDELRSAGRRLRSTVRSESGLWGTIGVGRRVFNIEASRAARRLGNAADALGVARTFTGERGPRRYFVALQNNAEMRDQGMVLSYAVVTFDGGRLTVERHGPIGELRLERPADVPTPPATQEVFGGLNPRQQWQSVNATADFPWSARTMAAMYAQATGQRVDGVIAVDVPALSALLRAVGPVEVPGLRRLDDRNVDTVLLRDLYEAVPVGDQTLRRDRLGDVADAVIDRLTDRPVDGVALGRDLAQAAAGGHLRLWSADDAEEAVFHRTGLGGGPATSQPDRTFHLAVQNATPTKLDYYLRTRVHMDVTLTDLGSAVVRTRVSLTNTAPRDGEPSYMLGRRDRGNQRDVGDYAGRLYLWGPRGSIQAGGVEESGLNLAIANASALPGETKDVEFQTVVPHAVKNGRLVLRLVPQPRLTPTPLTVRLDAPGRTIEGRASVRRSWARTLEVAWGVRD